MPASAVAKRTPGIGGTLGWRFGASGETGTSLPAIATSSCGTLLEDRRIVRWPGSASRSRVPLPQADDENKKGGRKGRPRNRGSARRPSLLPLREKVAQGPDEGSR